jgi:hypothetical protein
MRTAVDWGLVVLCGLAAMTSGFLAAVDQVATRRPASADLEVLVLGVGVRVGDVPTWPWLLLTPLLMTATFLLIQRAHRRADDRAHGRADEDGEGP